MSPALPVLIQIPVFLSAVKSVLYNFNFLQGLIPWSVIAQTPNPPTQPLAEELQPLPAQQIGGRPWFGSWFHFCTSQVSFSLLAFRALHSLPAKPEDGWWVGGLPHGEPPGEKVGSVGESQCCAAHLPPHPTPHTDTFHVSHLDGTLKLKLILSWFYSACVQEHGPMFEKDSQGAQESQHDPLLSLGLSLGAKDAVSLYQGRCQPVSDEGCIYMLRI